MALLLLSGGCAKKKEKAAELEKEMMGEETAVDSANAEALPPETLTAEEQPVDVDAVPAESRQETSSVSYGAAEGYTVQVAACESREYAEYLIRKYTQRGYEPFLTRTVEDGQTYHRVRIGDFSNRQEAEALRAELMDKYSVVDAWIDSPQ
jgi:cell division septation protein DedD